MTLDHPERRRRNLLLVFVPLLALVVIFILALRLRPGPESRGVVPKIPPPASEQVATNGNSSTTPQNPATSQGKGDLEIQFDLAFNTRFCAVVMRENTVEARQWVRLVADPRTDPRNFTPKNTKITNLSTGPKRLLLASSTGFVERKLDVVVRENETTLVRVEFGANPYKSLARLEGKVLDTQGKPVQGARIALETEDVERIGPSTAKAVELFSEEGGASALVHLHGPGDDAQPYSEEYLAWVLRPDSYHTSASTMGRQVFSDGSIRMYYITSETGQFHFDVKVEKPHVLTVEYRGVEKKESVRPVEFLTVVLPLEAASLFRFQDYYERAMKAMLSKDQTASQEIRQMLEARTRDPKTETELKFLEADFDEAIRAPCDFQDRDLSRRNAFISKIRKIAYRISMELNHRDK
jgi:hypothetical protein